MAQVSWLDTKGTTMGLDLGSLWTWAMMTACCIVSMESMHFVVINQIGVVKISMPSSDIERNMAVTQWWKIADERFQ